MSFQLPEKWDDLDYEGRAVSWSSAADHKNKLFWPRVAMIYNAAKERMSVLGNSYRFNDPDGFGYFNCRNVLLNHVLEHQNNGLFPHDIIGFPYDVLNAIRGMITSFIDHTQTPFDNVESIEDYFFSEARILELIGQDDFVTNVHVVTSEWVQQCYKILNLLRWTGHTVDDYLGGGSYNNWPVNIDENLVGVFEDGQDWIRRTTGMSRPPYGNPWSEAVNDFENESYWQIRYTVRDYIAILHNSYYKNNDGYPRFYIERDYSLCRFNNKSEDFDANVDVYLKFKAPSFASAESDISFTYSNPDFDVDEGNYGKVISDMSISAGTTRQQYDLNKNENVTMTEPTGGDGTGKGYETEGKQSGDYNGAENNYVVTKWDGENGFKFKDW